MTTTSTPSRPWHRRLAFRLSVRGLLALVLVVGGGLGWWVHRAKVQREAVEVILRAGGEVDYDGRRVDGRYVRGEGARWPRWLVDRVGIDFLGTVTMARVGLQDGDGSGEPIMAAVGRLDRLECLWLGRNKVTSDAVLAHLRGNRRLKELRIGVMTGEGLAYLAGLARLERLELPTIRATDADLAHLSGLTRLLDLSVTFDDSSAIGDAGLAQLRPLRELRTLHFNAATRLTNRGLALLAGLGRLEYLYLHDARFTDIKALATLEGLKALGLFSVPVDDAGLAPVAGFRSLENLHLSYNPRMTDAGLAHVRGLPELQSLTLQACHITDAGLEPLKACPKLESIVLRETAIGDEGLARLATMKGLRWIEVNWTKVTPEGVKAARVARPGVTIWD